MKFSFKDLLATRPMVKMEHQSKKRFKRFVSFEHEGNFADVLAYAITCMDAIEHREGKRWCTLMQPCGGA
jgi:hypothetical protein